MSRQFPEQWFIADSRVNAVIAWGLTGILLVAVVVNVLAGLLAAAGLAAAAAAAALVPPLAESAWQRTVPWPLLVVASIPFLLSGARPDFFGTTLTGLGVATLALLAVVALQLTTTVRMTPDFAVAFVVLTTLATAGLWAVTSAFSATYLGTAFLETNDELMVVFSAALVAGAAAGVVFRWYFRRRLAADARRIGGGGVGDP